MLSSGIGLGVGNTVASFGMISNMSSTFWRAAIPSGSGGFAGGFSMTTMSGISAGKSLGESFREGLVGGSWTGLAAGFFSGITAVGQKPKPIIDPEDKPNGYAIGEEGQMTFPDGKVFDGRGNLIYDPGAGTKGVPSNVAEQAKSWLGREYKIVTNKAGDNVFISQDGMRKIRFDIKNPHGDAPHIHLEIFKNGRWRDAIPGNHRIYPKQ
jgi:hypothetical protein